MKTLEGTAVRAIALACLTAGLALLGCSQPDDPRHSSERRQEARPAVLCLGDSITAGYRLPPHEAYPAIIARKLQAAGKNYTVINAGRAGDTTALALQRLPHYLKHHNIKILIIELGGNDERLGLAVPEIMQNLRAIIGTARRHDPTMKIMMFEMRALFSKKQDRIADYNRLFRRVAETENITLLPFPMDGVIANRALLQSDGVHPNPEGNRIMTENIWRMLERFH